MPPVLAGMVCVTAILTAGPEIGSLRASSVRETPLVRAVRDCRSAIVNIHTEKRETTAAAGRFLPPRERRVTGMGTGIVIDERGYIVTNCHVIQDVEQIIVTDDRGETYPARVVDRDAQHDLAIIQVNPVQPMTVLTIGTSSDVMLGEQVFAVGNAFGYEHTVTAGIVSAVSRNVEVDETQSYENLIQTDASINPGNSGGPLLNLDGEVIGINVAIRAGAQRIGFAIPIDDARRVIAQLMSTERRSGMTHGLRGRDVNTPGNQHLVVESVQPDSPAAECGLQPGDIIRRVDGRPVSDQADWERSLLAATSDTPVSVTIEREGEQQTVALTVQPVTIRSAGKIRGTWTASQTSAESAPEPSSLPPDATGLERAWHLFGIRLTRLSQDERARLPARYSGGMKIRYVRRGSRAARDGLRRGDILVGLDGYETLDERSLAFVLDPSRLKTASRLSFQIVRNGHQALMGRLLLTGSDTHRTGHAASDGR